MCKTNTYASLGGDLDFRPEVVKQGGKRRVACDTGPVCGRPRDIKELALKGLRHTLGPDGEMGRIHLGRKGNMGQKALFLIRCLFRGLLNRPAAGPAHVTIPRQQHTVTRERHVLSPEFSSGFCAEWSLEVKVKAL